MSKFIKSLEEKAHQLKRKLEQNNKDLTVPSMLKREIALSIEQIEKIRQIHEKQLQSLLEDECFVNSELMQMEQRTPRYSPRKYPEREKLQRRLLGLKAERRKLHANLEEKLRPLEDRLLSLLNKHQQLNTFENGH